MGGYFAPEAVGARVMGLIVSAGVMAASGELGSLSSVLVSVLIAVAIYWMAESYARALAAQMSSPRGWWPELRHELGQHWPIVEAASEPLLVMLLAAALGASDSTAITAGLITATALLMFYGWLGASRSGLTGRRRVGATLLVGVLGVAMIALKTYLHSPRAH